MDCRMPSSILASTPLDFYFFFFLTAPLRILVPLPGIEPKTPAVEAQGLNHWSTKEAPLPTKSYKHPFPYIVTNNNVTDISTRPLGNKMTPG